MQLVEVSNAGKWSEKITQLRLWGEMQDDRCRTRMMISVEESKVKLVYQSTKQTHP